MEFELWEQTYTLAVERFDGLRWAKAIKKRFADVVLGYVSGGPFECPDFDEKEAK